MELEDLFAKANDSITVGRVFGTPIERDGVLVIPVASVQGGGGGGTGTGTGPDGEGEGTGTGGGWGVRARPVGVFVVRDGTVQWVPVIDYVRFASAAAAVIIVGLLARRSIVKTRAKRSMVTSLAQARAQKR